MTKEIAVEVAYARPDHQKILTLLVSEGTTLLQVAEQSGICEHFPEIVLAEVKMGIFGKLSANPATQMVGAGERVEIYRPLLVDPKEVRRRRAEEAKAVKKS